MKSFKEFTEACWDGYKQIGMKKKKGKKVPNCVPEEEEIEEDSVKKVTSGEFAGRYMVKYIWNRRKETGIFDTKADAIKHAQLIRKTKGAKLDEESEYKGRKVKLNDPIRTNENPKKKFKVYVKNAQGKVVVVRFGDPNMEIKRDDPKRRAAFRARHNCDDKKDKTSPGYWSCMQWRAGAKVDN